MEWMIDENILLKLLLSSLLGAIIGLERELKRKPVGLKTSIVISVISCLLTIVSVESVYLYERSSEVNITMDPLRLAAQIVSGIGFLGAGVILHRSNDSISGLTTAAMIWGAAGIGIAVGAGFYAAAITGVLIMLAAVEWLPVVMRLGGPSRLREKLLFIRLRTASHDHVQSIIQEVESLKLDIKRLHIYYDIQNGQHVLEITASVQFKRRVTDVYYETAQIPHVLSADVESQ